MARRTHRQTPGSTEPAAVPTGSRLEVGVALVLAAVTLALYWPVHGWDFVNYDDVEYVRQNPAVRAGLTPASITWAFTKLYAGFWIPLTWLSFMLDTQLFGPGAGGYHVTNVLLHVANAVLLFGLLARATGRVWPSALVAGLFALHPIHVESVAWVTERKDVLSTLFLLLTLWSYGAYASRPTAQRYVGTLVVFVLGLMAKPMLATMPLLLLLLDLWPLGRVAQVPLPRLLLEKVPFLLLAVLSGLLTMFAGHHLSLSAPFEGVPIVTRLGNACLSYLSYLVGTVWPVGLAPLYPDPGPPALWRAGLAALLLAVGTVGAIRLAPRRPWVTVGWLWFVLALLPVSGLVKIGPFVMADRFTYVPLIGIFVLVAWELNELATRHRLESVAFASAAVVLALLGLVARRQIGYWRDSVTLFERTLAVTRDNPVAHYLLGLAFQERGRPDDALGEWTAALRVAPGFAHAHASVGQILFQRGQIDDAVAHYTAALRAEPDDAYAHSGLADVLLQQGQIDDAVAHYRTALQLAPDVPEIQASYGRALDAAGRTDDAVAQYTAALRLRPGDATAQVNLGALLAARGRFAEAVEHYLAALQTHPADARVRGDLGNALAAQGKLDDAVAQYEQALRLEPGYTGAHNNLANALVMLGRVDEGLSHYHEALRLDPGYAEAHVNLGMVLADHGRVDDAIAHYAEAIRLKPAYPGAHTLLGMALRTQGKAEQAREHFTAALRIDPGDATARRELGLDGGPRP